MSLILSSRRLSSATISSLATPSIKQMAAAVLTVVPNWMPSTRSMCVFSLRRNMATLCIMGSINPSCGPLVTMSVCGSSGERLIKPLDEITMARLSPSQRKIVSPDISPKMMSCSSVVASISLGDATWLNR